MSGAERKEQMHVISGAAHALDFPAEVVDHSSEIFMNSPAIFRGQPWFTILRAEYNVEVKTEIGGHAGWHPFRVHSFLGDLKPGVSLRSTPGYQCFDPFGIICGALCRANSHRVRGWCAPSQLREKLLHHLSPTSRNTDRPRHPIPARCSNGRSGRDRGR